MAKTAKTKPKPTKKTKKPPVVKKKVAPKRPSVVMPIIASLFPYVLFFSFIIGTSLFAKQEIEKMEGIGESSYVIEEVKGLDNVQQEALKNAIRSALKSSQNPYSPFGTSILRGIHEELSTIAEMEEVYSVQRVYTSDNGKISAKLSINALWRQPWAQVTKGKKRVWIDKAGFSLDKTTTFRDTDYPLITVKHGSFTERSSEERKGFAPWSDKHLQNAISLLHYLQDPQQNIPFNVRDIVVEFPAGFFSGGSLFSDASKTSLMIKTTEGYGIRWGAYNEQENSFVANRRSEVLNAARKMIAKHRGQLHRVDYFDISAIDGAETVTFK